MQKETELKAQVNAYIQKEVQSEELKCFWNAYNEAQKIENFSLYNESSVSDIDRALTFIPSDDYGVWFHVACALKNHSVKTKTDLFSFFDVWSAKSKKYKGTLECKKFWNAIKTTKEKKINIGTLFFYAKQHGYLKEKIENPLLFVNNFKDNVIKFYEKQPFFFDKNQMFWFWDKKEQCYKIVDDTEILISIETQLTLTGDLINSTIKNSYLEAFRQIGRQNIPKDAPKNWVQFKNCVFDLETGKKLESTPEWFFTNPIPHNLTERTETPQISIIFSEWVGNQSETLFEILAYCCLSDYPIHRLFVLIGSGSNGKSKFLELLTKFIGIKNVCSANLDKLTENNFHTTKLYKKLVCTMGETNFNVLEKTDIIKRLTGQDLIDFEFKGKQAFDDYNYAKIIIATNSLPMTTDKTDGFYRRWNIIKFPNKFEEKKNIIENIPDSEYDALASKCVLILMSLIKERSFTGDGTIEDRKQKYEDTSNPLQKFLLEMTEKSFDGFVFKFEFEKEFLSFLKNNNYRIWSNFEINKEMKKTYEDAKKHYTLFSESDKIYWAWIGLTWKKVPEVPLVPEVYIQKNNIGKQTQIYGTLGTLGTQDNVLIDVSTTNPYILVENLLLDKEKHEEVVTKLLNYVSIEVLEKGKTEGRWFSPNPETIKLL